MEWTQQKQICLLKRTEGGREEREKGEEETNFDSMFSIPCGWGCETGCPLKARNNPQTMAHKEIMTSIVQF